MPTPNQQSSKSKMSSHTPGTTRGEETVLKKGLEPGRETGTRTARDATSINAKARDPIDPRMPYMPPP
jgi:hypothetical protein